MGLLATYFLLLTFYFLLLTSPIRDNSEKPTNMPVRVKVTQSAIKKLWLMMNREEGVR